jgi:hypothetical protein
MTWDQLTSFIQREDPALAASLRGVPHERVELVEQEYGIRLPETYRQFLFTMGDRSDRLHLFGPGRTQRFDDLVAQLPTRIYPRGQFFKIAAAIDPSEISPDDYFLDLTRSDGVDAPIVAFQDNDDAEIEEFVATRVRDMPFTFSEQAAKNFFSILVLDRALDEVLLVVGPDVDLSGLRASVVEMLSTMGFRPLMPLEDRIMILRRGTLSAVLTVWDPELGTVSIALAGHESRELKIVVEQLVERFPEAAVTHPRGLDLL